MLKLKKVGALFIIGCLVNSSLVAMQQDGAMEWFEAQAYIKEYEAKEAEQKDTPTFQDPFFKEAPSTLCAVKKACVMRRHTIHTWVFVDAKKPKEEVLKDFLKKDQSRCSRHPQAMDWIDDLLLVFDASSEKYMLHMLLNDLCSSFPEPPSESSNCAPVYTWVGERIANYLRTLNTEKKTFWAEYIEDTTLVTIEESTVKSFFSLAHYVVEQHWEKNGYEREEKVESFMPGDEGYDIRGGTSL